MRGRQVDFRAEEPPELVDRVPKDARRDSAAARGPRMPGGAVIRWWAGFASLGAGLIHLAVVSEHVSEWWLYGVFFIVLGVVQMGWAVEAMESKALPVPRLFAAMNAAVIGLWLVTRTTGLPVGPGPWKAEAVGTADLVCSGLEAVLVVLLVLTVRRPHVQESAALTKAQRRMIAAGALATAAVTVAALAATPPVFFGHAHPHGAASVLR
jgi:hypothetical protein